MVMNTVSIPPDLAKGRADIAAISAAIEPLLATYGEPNFLAGVAYSVGLRRMLDLAAEGPERLLCEEAKPQPAACARHAKPLASCKPQLRVKTVYYYVIGCNGARNLAKLLKRPVFKVGYIYKTAFDERLDWLDKKSYGGWGPKQAIACLEEPLPGWAKWRPACHKPADTAHLMLPGWISVEDGVWRLELPDWVDVEQFDRIVTAAMQSRELSFWARSGEGRAHCAKHDIDPEECVRYSRHEETGDLRPVEELYAYNPRRDAAWFATILIGAMNAMSQGRHDC